MMLINIAGLLLIALIVWWFWLYTPNAAANSAEELVVLVNNGVYQPSRIKLTANQATTLRFLREDGSPCAEMLIFPDIEISESLPLNKQKDIQLPALSAGEYAFHCQMKMYRGSLVVE